MTHKPHRALLLALAALVTLLGLWLAAYRLKQAMYSDPELLSPLSQIERQAQQSGSFFESIADPDLGFVVAPNLNQTIATDDFTFVRTTDAHGFPNEGPWPTHADVVITGDSFLIGDGVGTAGAFVSLAASRLPDLAVLNLGQPAAGLERQRLIFERYGAATQPSIVIAALYPAADLRNDRHWFAWRADARGMTFNEFRLRYDRRTKAPESALARRIAKNSVLNLLQSLVEPHLPGNWRIMHRRRMPDGQEIFFSRPVVKMVRGPVAGSDPDIATLAAVLDRYRADAARVHARFAVLLIPSKEELFAIDQPPRSDTPIARIRRLLDDKAIPYLDLYPVVLASAERATPFFRRDIHLNRYGNEVVADALTDWCRRLQASAATASVVSP